MVEARTQLAIYWNIIKTVTLKSDRPTVHEALERLDRELTLARNAKTSCLKIIHGYGSTGAGGDIRIAVQKRLVSEHKRCMKKHERSNRGNL